MTQSFDDLYYSYKSAQFLLTQQIADHLSFAIITACNPKGQLLSQSQNRIRDKQLLKEIERLNCLYRSIIGADKKLSYFEKSWAVFVEKNTAIQLGSQFVQNAIYYVENGKLTLIPILMQGKEVELGSFHQRTNLISEFPDLLTASH